MRLGTKALFGWKQNTNGWSATEETLGANDGLELDLSGGGAKPQIGWAENNASPFGPAIRYRREKMREWVEGAFKFNLMYNALGRVYASLFGEEAVAAGAGTGYTHLFTFSPEWNDDRSVATCGWVDNLVAHVIDSCKPTALTWTFNTDAIASLDVPIFGRREKTDGSGLNNKSDMESNITVPNQPAIRYPVLSNAQTALRIAKASSAALGSADDFGTADVLYPTNITITASRNPKQYWTPRNAPYPDCPYGGDWYGYEMSFTLPVDQTTALYDEIVSGTELKADVTFTGTTIGGGDSYTLLWQFPSITVDADGLPEPNTPDLLEITIPCTIHTARSNPTGMAFSEPRFTLTDAISGYHLASATT